MDNLTTALKKITNYLRKEKIRYMIIGGIANMIWGEPRFTRDIDIKIFIGFDILKKIISKMQKNFKVMVKEPEQFVKEIHVLPIEVNDIHIDLIFASLSYELQALKRAKNISLGRLKVTVCTAEDLIIHKAISERERDWEDIRGILLRRKRLNRRYVQNWLRKFSKALNRDLLAKFLRIEQQIKQA